MRLTMRERKKVTGQLACRYRRENKRMKGQTLDRFIEVTGYNRCHGSWLLRNHGRGMRLNDKLTIVGDVNKKTKRKGKSAGNSRIIRVLYFFPA